MRRMREDRRTLGSSADLSNVRRHPVLRQFTEPACQQARAPERASTLRWYYKIPHTRNGCDWIVTDNLGDENDQRSRCRHRNPESFRAWPRNTFSRRKRTSTHTKAGFGPIEWGDFARVRRFQPVDRLNNRISGSVVCHLAD